jgi:hypothetical protein
MNTDKNKEIKIKDFGHREIGDKMRGSQRRTI